MQRFLAFFADPRSAAHYEALQELAFKLAAQHWHLLHATNALHVWSRRPSPAGRQNLLQRQCILIGDVFPRPQESSSEPAEVRPLPPMTFDAGTAKRVAESRGAAVIHECWGDYVVLLHDLASLTTRIQKDPTGSLHCELTQWREFIIAFSCVEDVLALGVPRFTLRGSYLRSRARVGALNMLESPLNEVRPVLRGEWVDIVHRAGPRVQARGFGWHPNAFVTREAAIESPMHAARALETTLRTCALTLVEGHTHPLLRLSGGLDSSIIASCIARPSDPLRQLAYTHYDPTAVSDERPWAQCAAEHLQLTHRCEPMDPTAVDLQKLDLLQAQVTPPPLLSYLQRATLERRLAERFGSSAIVTGLGGDSVFGGDALGYAATEWLHYHGPSVRFLSLAAQVARVTQQSMWTLVGRALRRRLVGPSRADHRRAMHSLATLLHPQLKARPIDEHRYPHPWFADARRLRWAIVRRLGELVVPPHYYWADAPADTFSPKIISPIYAQPVVELCLRIPLHVHFLNGTERGLARTAFAAHLPRKIIARTWKDRAPGYLEQLLSRSRPYLRERLLEGVLAREQIVDRTAIEAALRPTLSRGSTLPGELLHLLEVELWARHWASS